MSLESKDDRLRMITLIDAEEETQELGCAL